MYKLNRYYIKEHYNEFIGAYNNHISVLKISRPNFSPETFYVNQKRKGEKLIFFNDMDYTQWVSNMVKDICYNMCFDNNIQLHDLILENIETLMDYRLTDSKITNQEFVDIIRKVAIFTIYGDVTKDIDMSTKFNSLAKNMMPSIIQSIRDANLDLKTLLIYSILSGLIGLDLKGAPAAASSHSNDGIPLKMCYDMSNEERTKYIIDSINDLFSKCTCSLFDYDEFIDKLETSKTLVWMTDDYIETYFDLLVIEEILTKYKIKITIVPKNGHFGNDICYQDLSVILNSGLFPKLNHKIKNGDLFVSPKGPKMGTANLYKFSDECIKIIEKADFLVLKGCRIHEMLQGGINKETFSSFNIVRQLSEISSGFSSTKNIILFFHLNPKEYSFFGINYNDVILEKKGDNSRYNSVSTIREHFERKRNLSIDFNVEQFLKLNLILNNYTGNVVPLCEELNMIAKNIEVYTAKQYDCNSITYKGLCRPSMERIETQMWNVLFKNVKTHISEDLTNIELLDVGTGDGKALEYLCKLGINSIGVDNSKGFLDVLKQKSSEGKIPSESFVYSNMCSLCFEDNTFDVVRFNASLLHLPIISKGYTVDLALSEAHRVLKSNGLIFIMVKKGEGLKLIDTGEGLGKRVYQLYSNELLNSILKRNRFTIVEEIEIKENRNGQTIEWLVRIAKK